MADPFAVLRAADEPVPPDPYFAGRLRARLERTLALPRGVSPVSPVPEEQSNFAPRPAAVPYLAVSDARRAIEWYVDVFGAQPAGDPIVMPDGRIGHAALTIAGGMLYLADAHPEIGVTAPRAGEATVSLMLPVDDADAVRARAMAAGASGERAPYDGYGTRNAWIVDPFGHRWGLNSPLREASAPRYRHGDVGYVSLDVTDVERAAEFYRAVLGWDLERRGTGLHTRGVLPSTGIATWMEPKTLFCCYAVEDVHAAAERVRAAGGEAGDPHDHPYGRVVDCVDDQGTRFAMYEQPDEVAGPRPGEHGRQPGDLAYLTLEVIDSTKARAFYGTVLGWRSVPGRVEDGWQIEGTVPMIGLSGGHPRASAVPMWRVADIETAVTEVRARGGSATEPERQAYGVTSQCTDDQGGRFYLGQL